MADYLKTPILFLFLVMFISNCNSPGTSANNISNKKVQLPSLTKYDSTAFETAFHTLNAGNTLEQSVIDSFARGLDTRADFYDLLAEFGKQNLFPKAYLSFEKAAESKLTTWLEFPTELDTIPSAIELLKRVEYLNNDTTFIYYVFQFKTEEPHWAAKDGWMVGVVGPYFKNSSPYDWTPGTFSKFSKIRETTPEKEVSWVHKNVYEKNDD